MWDSTLSFWHINVVKFTNHHGKYWKLFFFLRSLGVYSVYIDPNFGEIPLQSSACFSSPWLLSSGLGPPATPFLGTPQKSECQENALLLNFPRFPPLPLSLCLLFARVQRPRFLFLGLNIQILWVAFWEKLKAQKFNSCGTLCSVFMTIMTSNVKINKYI